MRMTPLSGSDDPRARVPAYILAGGRSRRYGSDKARAVVEGQPLIVRIANTIEAHATRITVVARRKNAYDDIGLRTIGDVVEGKGPMGGLLTAVEDARESGWIFVTACDWVGVRTPWVGRLLERRRSDAQAVVYRSDLYQPLFGLYRTSIHDIVLKYIDNGDVKMQNLLRSLATVSLPLPHDWDRAINLNRPDALDPGN